MLLNRKLKLDGAFEERLNKTAASNSKTSTSLFSRTNLNTQQPKQLAYKESLLNGINHPRIRQLILNHQNISGLLSSSNSNSKQNLKSNITNLQMMQERKWLTKKGKKYLIDFDDNQRKQMKNCFNAMDLQQNGSIGIDQLQQLLISVGLMNTREEVKQLIDSVDQDKSGKIQFSEFLKMILNDQGQNQEIVRFFKYIINSNKKQFLKINDWKNTQITQNSSYQHDSPIKKMSLKVQKQHSCCNKSLFPQEKFTNRLQKNRYLDSNEFLNDFSNLGQNSALNIFEKHPHPKNLPFGMIISHIRRKHMLTALKIGPQTNDKMKKKSSLASSNDENKSNHYISNTLLRSSKHMKDSKVSLSQTKCGYTEEQVQKGQNVMNSLRKMWDRRLLRQIREKKSKKQQNSLLVSNSMTEKAKATKPSYKAIS